jgi:hypothetical protein
VQLFFLSQVSVAFTLAFPDFKEGAQNAIKIHSEDYFAFISWDLEDNGLPMNITFYKKAKLALAENLEKCGRTQDAAKVFEELRMYMTNQEN